MISVSKLTIPRPWGLRSSLFIENCVPYHAIDQAVLHPNYVAAAPEDGHLNLLQVTGVIRRKNLNPYKPVLISGGGAFQILRVDVTPMKIPTEFISAEQLEHDGGEVAASGLPPRFFYDPLAVPQEEVDTVENNDDEVTLKFGTYIVSGNVYLHICFFLNMQMRDDDMSDIDALSDNDYPSEDDDDDDDDDDEDDSQSQMSMDVESESGAGVGTSKKKKKKAQTKQGLPKGTSEYQADWLVNSDGEADQDIIGSDEELENDEEESEGDDYDDNQEMDWEEEKRQVQIRKGK